MLCGRAGVQGVEGPRVCRAGCPACSVACADCKAASDAARETAASRRSVGCVAVRLSTFRLACRQTTGGLWHLFALRRCCSVSAPRLYDAGTCAVHDTAQWTAPRHQPDSSWFSWPGLDTQTGVRGSSKIRHHQMLGGDTDPATCFKSYRRGPTHAVMFSTGRMGHEVRAGRGIASGPVVLTDSG